MFFFRRKKIVVDFYTKHESVAKFFPVKAAHSYTPDWWKNLSPTYETMSPKLGRNIPSSTMKFCSGFTDLYNRGLIMPLWAELIVDVYDNWYAVTTSDDKTPTDFHDSKQHGNTFSDYLHLKLEPPWLVSDKTDTKFLYMPCTWSLLPKHSDFFILHGVSSYSIITTSNINMFLKKAKTDKYTLNIKAGMPLMHFIPLSDVKVVPKLHVVDPLEYEKIKFRYVRHSFVGSYQTSLKQLKK